MITKTQRTEYKDMDEIIDEIEKPIQNSKFTKLSIFFAIIAGGSFVCVCNLMLDQLNVEHLIVDWPLLISTRITQLFSILGIVMTINSFIKKEPSNWQKWLSVFLSLILLLLLIVPIGLYYFKGL